MLFKPPAYDIGDMTCENFAGRAVMPCPFRCR